jgi:hypothetical protein
MPSPASASTTGDNTTTGDSANDNLTTIRVRMTPAVLSDARWELAAGGTTLAAFLLAEFLAAVDEGCNQVTFSKLAPS